MNNKKMILITGCSVELNWYAQHIGYVFTIVDEDSSRYIIKYEYERSVSKIDAIPVTLHSSRGFDYAVGEKQARVGQYGWIEKLKIAAKMENDLGNYPLIEASTNPRLIADGILSLKDDNGTLTDLTGEIQSLLESPELQRREKIRSEIANGEVKHSPAPLAEDKTDVLEGISEKYKKVFNTCIFDAVTKAKLLRTVMPDDADDEVYKIIKHLESLKYKI